MNFHNVEFESSYGQPNQLPVSDFPEIAFAGRSNVGKSSMINKIFNRKALARVSSVPGKTTTINFFRLEDVRFADLPGYGFARRSKAEKQRWGVLMEHYFSSGRDLQLVFQLLDMRHPPSRDDLTMINFLIDSETPFVLVLTKADKLSKKQQAERLEAFPEELPCEGVTMIPFSSQTGLGVETIHAIIEEITQQANMPEDEEPEDE